MHGASALVFRQVVTMTTGAVVPSDKVVTELRAAGLWVVPTLIKVLFGIKGSEAAVSPCVGVVRGKQKRKAATRRGAEGVNGRLKLSKAFFAAQNGDGAFVCKHLHGIVFTVLAVLQVQVDELEGDDVAFSGTSAPVQSGVGQVSVGVPW